MREASERVRREFDRLALLPGAWDPNSVYHRRLIRRLPTRLRRALDVGCGTGAFSRLLAARADRVVGVDLSPAMIETARSLSTAHSNLSFRVGDAMTERLPRHGFDAVVSIAALHHLPLEPAMHRLRSWVAPGGTLLVLDLHATDRPKDLPVEAAAVVATGLLRWLATGRLREPPAVRRAWASHARLDRLPSLRRVRRATAAALPGARLRRHLLWRYSIDWDRPVPQRAGR